MCKQKEATVYLTRIEGDKVQKVDLCEECAKKQGVNDPAVSLADMLMGIGTSKEFEKAPTAGGEPSCPKCGFTQADFKKAGRLGCPECYTTFADGIAPLLTSMHKGSRHTGKTPRVKQAARDLAARVKQLHQQMAKAIDSEDFERAAAIRDELRQINAQISGSGDKP